MSGPSAIHVLLARSLLGDSLPGPPPLPENLQELRSFDEPFDSDEADQASTVLPPIVSIVGDEIVEAVKRRRQQPRNKQALRLPALQPTAPLETRVANLAGTSSLSTSAQRSQLINEHLLNLRGVSEHSLEQIENLLLVYSHGFHELVGRIIAAADGGERIGARVWKLFLSILQQCEPVGVNYQLRLMLADRHANSAMRNERFSSRTELEQLHEREKKLQEEIKRLGDQIQRAHRERRTVEEERLRMFEQHARHGQAVNQLVAEIFQLRGKRKHWRQKNVQSSNRLSLLHEDERMLRRQLLAAQQRKEEAVREHQDRWALHDKVRSEYDRRALELRRLEEVHMRLQRKALGDDRRISELRPAIDGLRKGAKMLQGRIPGLQANLESTQQETVEARKREVELLEKVSKMEAELQALQAVLAQLPRDIASVEADISSTREAAAQHRTATDKTREDSQAVATVLAVQQAELDAALEEERQLEELRTVREREHAEAQEKLDAAELRRNTLCTERDAAERSITAMKAETADAKKRIRVCIDEGSQARKAAAIDAKTARQLELSITRVETEEAAAAEAHTARQARQLEREQGLQARIRETREQLEHETGRANDMARVLEVEQTKRRAMAGTLEETHRATNEARVEAHQYVLRAQDCRSQLNEFERERSRLETQIKREEKQLETWREREKAALDKLEDTERAHKAVMHEMRSECEEIEARVGSLKERMREAKARFDEQQDAKWTQMDTLVEERRMDMERRTLSKEHAQAEFEAEQTRHNAALEQVHGLEELIKSLRSAVQQNKEAELETNEEIQNTAADLSRQSSATIASRENIFQLQSVLQTEGRLSRQTRRHRDALDQRTAVLRDRAQRLQHRVKAYQAELAKPAVCEASTQVETETSERRTQTPLWLLLSFDGNASDQVSAFRG